MVVVDFVTRTVWFFWTWSLGMFAICRVMSSVHRVLGRARSRLELCLESVVGSHVSALWLHLWDSLATLPASLHLYRRWVIVQSSMPSALICLSASWVHLRIQSSQGSNLFLSSVCCRAFVCVSLLSSTLVSSALVSLVLVSSALVSSVLLSSRLLSVSLYVDCGEVVGLICVGSFAWRLAELRIILSICRWVRFKRFSNSSVIVHAALPYRTVGVTVP